MNCENELCIYQSKHLCVLSEISVNDMGMCEDCVQINVPRNILEKEKQKTLDHYREIDELEQECENT